MYQIEKKAFVTQPEPQHHDIYATKEHYKCKICYRPVVWDRVKLTNHMSKEHKMSLEIYHRKHHFYYSNEKFH